MSAQARREQFVEAAIRVMSREGLDRATTRRIAEEAGAPHGTFHYAFRDKNELLMEVVGAVTRQVEHILTDAVDPRRGLRLVTWAPHLLGLWCADGRQSACYAGKPARPGIVIHRTVAPFRGITVPALACLAAQGSLVHNLADAAFPARDKLLTTVDLVAAGIPVVPTAAFDEPAGADLAALGPGE